MVNSQIIDPEAYRNAYRIGQRVVCYPQSFEQVDQAGRIIKGPMSGTIVWIHPAGQYVTVAFETPGGVIKESFHPWEISPVSKG